MITLSWYQYRILAILLKSIDPNPVAYLLFRFHVDVYVLLYKLRTVCALRTPLVLISMINES